VWLVRGNMLKQASIQASSETSCQFEGRRFFDA